TADYIYDNVMYETVNGTNATINWSEPLESNGAVISYDIQYFKSTEFTDKAKAEYGDKICLNQWQYLLNRNSFTMTGLDPGTNYSYRVRANSIHGTGNWTTIHTFTVPGDTNIIVYITVGMSVVLITFVLLATLCYIRAPRKTNSQLDIISVNPEYEKFIVDPEWEVRSQDLKKFHVLGDGAFGRVYYGELRKNNKTIGCAVKTLNQNKGVQHRDNFLKEANIMKSFVDCHHIVKLIGIVSIENPVLVLMEYMVNGDLKNYLRLNRPDSDENPNPRVPTWNRIFQMAIEISDGMAYLAARKFVHRDLAARNCMVAEDLTVKIGDFGMTRDIYDNDYYRKRDCGLIPVRWMSPESLKDGMFTTYSDIWAYGVVLYEMVTLGAQPYQGCSNETVLQNVIKGYRLPEPENCPKKLWKIMQFCWRKHPKARPSFNEITEFLLPTANQSFREVCYYLNNSRKSVISTRTASRMKKSWYAWLPTNRLILSDLKLTPDFVDDPTQYCPMSPVLNEDQNSGGTELTAADEELKEQQIKILNKINEQKTIDREGVIKGLDKKCVDIIDDNLKPQINENEVNDYEEGKQKLIVCLQ
ncbi:unnamed protein product, partial [Oppiella nova]